MPTPEHVSFQCVSIATNWTREWFDFIVKTTNVLIETGYTLEFFRTQNTNEFFLIFVRCFVLLQIRIGMKRFSANSNFAYVFTTWFIHVIYIDVVRHSDNGARLISMLNMFRDVSFCIESWSRQILVRELYPWPTDRSLSRTRFWIFPVALIIHVAFLWKIIRNQLSKTPTETQAIFFLLT